MNISGTGLKPQHKAFLIWLVETFGYTINRVSMAEIGVQSGNNKQTVCNYINRLEKCGCITVDKQSAYKWTITISKSKYEDVINGRKIAFSDSSDNIKWDKTLPYIPLVLREIRINIESKGETYNVNLRSIERDFLMTIILFTRAGVRDFAMSYTDIAEYLKCSRTTACRMCNIFIKNKLFKLVNEGQRKGTTKSVYIINMETLQTLIDNYCNIHNLDI